MVGRSFERAARPEQERRSTLPIGRKRRVTVFDNPTSG
jgi:hypothetical protein